MLARLQLQRGDATTAEETLRQAVSSVPDDGTLHRMLGSSLAVRGEMEEAQPILERAYDLAPEDGLTLSALGVLLSEIGDDEPAIEILSQAILQGAGTPAVVFGLFRSQVAVGDIRAAERSLIRLELLHAQTPQAAAARAIFDQVGNNSERAGEQ